MSLTPAQIKPKSFESTRNSSSSFLPGVDASHVYVRAWALGCFHRLISTQTCSECAVWPHSEHRFPAPSSWRKDVVNQCYTQPLQNESVVCSGSRFTTPNNNSYIALYPVNIYKLAALYIINIKIRLTIKKVQVLYMHTSISKWQKNQGEKENKQKRKKKKGRRSKVP